MDNSHRIDEILQYWFGQLDEHGMATPAQQQLWFKSSAATDAHIQKHYLNAIEAALRDELEDWRGTIRGNMALLLLLDQFTRNVFRDSQRAFSGDPQALTIAQALVSSGQHYDMPLIYRVFTYVPYEHSESLLVQNAGVVLFDDLLEQSPLAAQDAIAGFRRYAVAHQQVIEQFGRFPHRNAILQRASSAAELEHLEQHGGF